MKLTVQLTPKIELSIEAETQKDAFIALSQGQEVFGEGKCGVCGKDNIVFRTRNSTAKQGKNKGKTFTYFELVCVACGCFLPVGQHNSDAGTLFPDRKIPLEGGTGELVYDKKNKGWRKATHRTDGEDSE